MELAQLRALRELGDRGSIAAVAAAMRVTPSSVSQQLAALQRGVDVPLTERIGRRTTLTAAGRALSAAVVDVEIALAKADESVGRFHAEPVGDVTVAAFTSAALALFGPLLAAPSRSTVAVSVSDHDVQQDAFPSLALDHDLVVAHRLRNSPPWPSSVAVVPLLEEPLDIALRQGHPLSRFDAVGADQLRTAEWVAVHDGFPLEGAIETLSTLAGIDAAVRHRVNDFAVAASVVAATDCVALLPRHLAADSRPPGIDLRPTRGFSVTRRIDALARPEALQRRTVQTVLGEIRGRFGALAG
ncbi:DNA-binding transcriptional LysR family regulator [Frondihabitans sp. PhB188]|uniref:LysR family transcriptional regulator n=1 Tax=Frondihabitans sp. PhB188 TaxID=2485200 RepID=UPI000F48A200|nr:LysR family transcriptional regulator [Frondihabitans sp. PhB188]ROQ38707.1 DNA-binding transcriptional LysR family regulator [Frondihabitans sp. PhB188]